MDLPPAMLHISALSKSHDFLLAFVE